MPFKARGSGNYASPCTCKARGFGNYASPCTCKARGSGNYASPCTCKARGSGNYASPCTCKARGSGNYASPCTCKARGSGNYASPCTCSYATLRTFDWSTFSNLISHTHQWRTNLRHWTGRHTDRKLETNRPVDLWLNSSTLAAKLARCH